MAMATSSPSSSKAATHKAAKPFSSPSRRQPLQEKVQPRSSSPLKQSNSSTVAKRLFKPSAPPRASSQAQSKPSRGRRASSPWSERSSSSAGPSSPKALRASTPTRTPPTTVPSSDLLSATTHTVIPLTLHKKAKVSITIPHQLPTPQLTIVSNPHSDLAAHLRRHNLAGDAAAVEGSEGMPVEFLLHTYLGIGAADGRGCLHRQTSRFMEEFQTQIEGQIMDDGRLPAAITLESSSGSQDGRMMPLPPTHLLAVYSSTEEVTLHAIHDMVLALQCASIPFLPSRAATASGGTSNATAQHDSEQPVTALPVMPLCVPHPAEFGITHRWLYSQGATGLFRDLIPIRFVVRLLSSASAFSGDPSAKTTAQDLEGGALYASPSIAQALSYLPTTALLDVLKRIQAVWKNGVALGILSSTYWSQLEKAWGVVVEALVIAKTKKANAHEEQEAEVEEARVAISCASI